MTALIRPSSIQTVSECERRLEDALRQLRKLDGGANTYARSALEYRIGALRRRRAALQDAEPMPRRRAS